MGLIDIVGTPVQLDVRFLRVDETPPPDHQPPDHFLNGPGVAVRMEIEQLLPPDARAALERILTTPLDAAFYSMWSDPKRQQQLTHTTRASLQKARPHAYDIDVSLPARGTLRADVVQGISDVFATSYSDNTAGVQLVLSYLLSGAEVRWHETTNSVFGSYADPGIKAVFDIELLVYVAVPDDSAMGLAVRSDVSVSPPAISGTDLISDLELDLASLYSFLSEQPINPPAGQTIAIDAGPFAQTFAAISTMFTAAARYGFRRQTVFIDTDPPSTAPAGNTVTFVLTHPIDPAPGVGNTVDIEQGPFALDPHIGTERSQVNAGKSVAVTGVGFRPSQAHTLQIQWSDTTTGEVAFSEVQWGLAPALGNPPSMPAVEMIPRRSYDNANSFIGRNLLSNSLYAFRVRDFDVPGLVATAWSDWLFLATSNPDQVDLSLADGSNSAVGGGPVQFDGSFSAPANIPADEKPGKYMLWASVAGEQLASTTIEVVAAGVAIGPSLEIYDPTTSLAFTSMNVAVTTEPVHLRGYDFAAGTVDLFIDSPTGQNLGTATADQNGAFTAAPVWPYGVTGHRQAVAIQNSLQAATPSFEVEDPPK